MVLDRESGEKVFNAVDNRIKIYANELFKKSPYNSTCWGRVISSKAGLFTVEINKKIYNNIVALRNIGAISANEVVMIGIPNNQMNNAVILGVADGSMQQSSGSGTVTSVSVSGGTGLSSSGSPITSSGTITINHTNSIVAQSTQAVYPITFDSEGHITASGTAVVIPTNYVTLDTTQTITGTKTFSADPIISGIKNGSYTLSVPTLSANSVIALTSQIPTSSDYVDLVSVQTISGTKTFSNNTIFSSTLSNGTYTYTLPSLTGTFALTSQLFSHNYDDLINRPILNTNNATALSVNATETITGTISLHKISKTGTFSDLVSKPTTISGYGITDAYTKTETDTKYAHSLVLSGTSLYLYNNLSTPAALSTLTISDSSSASAISTNARLVTERDIYYGLPNINGVHTYTSSTSIYAPTSQLSTSTSKRYIIGASSTTSMATENTNASCYMENGVLYSNNLATLNTGNISTSFNSTDTQTYSTKYIEDNFAQMLYTTMYYANKTATTTADLTSTIPTLNSANYLSSTTTNTAFNWTTPNYTFTNTLTGNLSLQASSLIYLSLPFSISLASQTVNFGYRVKMNGVAISSNQTFGAVVYTGGSGHTDVNRVYLQCTTDLLTEKTNYVASDALTFEIFTQQATSTSMTTRVYCGVTIGDFDYYTFNELAQFRSQLSNATPTEAGIVYGQTSNINTNTFYGYNAGLNNTTARDNIAIGLNALYSNSVALRNIAIGKDALYNNGLDKSGSAESNDNIALGDGALEYSKRGYSNIAIGNNALLLNSSDSANICESNVAIGILSQEFNSSGSFNTSIGSASLMYNSGSNNVAVGIFSGMRIGDNSSLNNSDDSVFIGSYTKALAENQTNEIVIGYETTGHGSNTATIGNSSITDNYFTGNIHLTGTILGMYPIGAIYISTVSTSPASLFGGTWTALQDTFLLGAGSTYTAGNTGGSATHTLTVAEMPTHKHILKGYRGGGTNDAYSGIGSRNNTQYTAVNDNVNGIQAEGGGESHNNMPPYLVVYMWKRTA